MNTYPLYALVARPKTAMFGQCGAGYVTDEEGNTLSQLAVLRQKIHDAQRIAQNLSGLLSSQGFVNQALTTVARLKEQHRFWHERFLLANRHKHEALGHMGVAP